MARRVMAAIEATPPSVSFEFFPPKDQTGERELASHIARLEAINPDFVSVTYGAGGRATERLERSLAITRWLTARGSRAAMAHLTCVGQTRAELEGALEAFTETGIDAVLALRGDGPSGPGGDWTATPGGFDHATDLIDLVRQRHSELDIGVAAFPYGHPTCSSLEADADVLADKQAAGASFAITQLFFEPAAYGRLLDRAERAGASLPILPGIMPLTTSGQIGRLETISGAPLPKRLLAAVEAASDDPAAVRQIGLDWAIELIETVLAAGAPGIHFYTLNSSTATLEIYDRLRQGGVLARP